MIAEALAAVRPSVLARIGGPIGVRARALAAELARMDPAQQKRTRAEWSAIARAPVPPGLRGVHATWIEHALESMPPRAREAVATGGGDPVSVWLARWVTAELVAMPATKPGPVRVPEDAAQLDHATLAAWLASIGHDQLAHALGDAVLALGEPLRVAARRILVAPRAGNLGPLRAAIRRCAGHDALEIGARTIAPHLSAETRRQVVLRLPRSIGFGVARAFADDARTPIDQGPAWAALVA